VDIEDAEKYRTTLETEIDAHASRAVRLLIVDDVASWAAERSGYCQGNPIAMAVTDGESGAWGIVICRSIDQARVRSVLDRIEVGGSSLVLEKLRSPGAFLRHTVLHELAHLENSWGQDREDACDEWAFERFDAHAA